MQKVLQTGKKHCWKIRNCLLQAISPFPSVFKRLILQTHKNQGLFGKGLNLNYGLPEPIADDKILDLSKLKGFANGNKNFKLL